MPLARILTFDPDQVNDFAQRLYELGFEVDVVKPSEQPVTPADLEIEFAVCDQQQILARAAAIATQLQAEIVVFPRAIPPLPKAITAVQEMAESPVPVPENQHVELLAQLEDVAEAQAENPMLPSEGSDLDRQALALDPRESAPSILPGLVKNLDKHSTRLAATLARGFAGLKAGFSSTSRAVAAGTARLGRALQSCVTHARAAAARQLAEIRRQRAKAAQYAAALDRQRQEQAGLPATHSDHEMQLVLAEKEALLAEIERLRAEAEAQSTELEQARAAEETQRQRQQQALPASSRQQEPARPAARKWAMVASWRSRQLRGALAGAVTAIFMLLLGMVWANFHAVAPLPADLSTGSVEQQIPFGAATVHGPPGVTVGGVSSAKSVPANNVPATTAPQPRRPQAVAPSVKPSPEWHHFRNNSRPAAESSTADDVVVRHFSSSGRKTTQTAQQRNGVIRYSDE